MELGGILRDTWCDERKGLVRLEGKDESVAGDETPRWCVSLRSGT